MILLPIEISRHPGDFLSKFRRIVHYSSPIDTGDAILINYRVQLIEESFDENNADETFPNLTIINADGQEEVVTPVKRRWMIRDYSTEVKAVNETLVNSNGIFVPENTAGAIGQYNFLKYVIGNNLVYYKDLWYNNIRQLDGIGRFDVYLGEG